MGRKPTTRQAVMGTVLLAAMVGTVALTGRRDEVASERDAILRTEAHKFDAVSFAALDAWSTAEKTIKGSKYTFTRRLAISDTSPTHFTVKIVVTPLSQPEKRDSVILERVVADARE